MGDTAAAGGALVTRYMKPGEVADTAAALLLCVGEALSEVDAGAPARSCVVPGTQVAWDQCDCGGQLTVHVPQDYPSDTFPNINRRALPGCAPQLQVVEYVVTILRCAPSPDQRGKPPSCEELEAAFYRDMADRDAVRKGVACCLDAKRFPFLLQEHNAVGSDGGCVGSQLRVFVRHTACVACE